jgi:hypothetical protein
VAPERAGAGQRSTRRASPPSTPGRLQLPPGAVGRMPDWSSRELSSPGRSGAMLEDAVDRLPAAVRGGSGFSRST